MYTIPRGREFLQTGSGLLHLLWVCPFVWQFLYSIGRLLNGITLVSERSQEILMIKGSFFWLKVMMKALVFSDRFLMKLARSISEILWQMLNSLNSYQIRKLDLLRHWDEGEVKFWSMNEFCRLINSNILWWSQVCHFQQLKQEVRRSVLGRSRWHISFATIKTFVLQL